MSWFLAGWRYSKHQKVAPEPIVEEPHCVVSIGNPGSGKSLLLNSLVGQTLFKSGYSAGRGCTAKLAKRKHNNIVYIDTPGLADVFLREIAAENITEALKQQSHYKLLFVATLEGWNFRPEDQATLELALGAIKGIDLTDRFGIIVNKVPKETPDENVWEHLESLKTVEFSIDTDHAFTTTKHIMYLKEQDIDDDGDTLQLPGEFKEFIQSLPKVFIDKAENVTKVQTSKWADRMEELSKQREALKAQQDEMRAELWRLRAEQGSASAAAAPAKATARANADKEETTEKDHEVEENHPGDLPEGEEVLLLIDAEFDDIKVIAGAKGTVTAAFKDSLKVKMDDKDYDGVIITVPPQKRHLICKTVDEQQRKDLKVHELAHRGITLGALLDFYGKLLRPENSSSDFEFKPEEHTTFDVVRNVVIPVTSGAAKSYAEVIHSSSCGFKAARMVSHNWGNLFTHLIAAIVADALDTDFFAEIAKQLASNFNGLYDHLRFMNKLQIPYWVCAFCVNQHVTGCKRSQCPCNEQNLSNLSPLCEVDKFDKMMELIFEPGEEASVKSTRHVVAVDAKCGIFKRAWVVAELVVALTLKTTVTQKYKFIDEDSIQRLQEQKIDVRTCDASRKEDIDFVLDTARDRITERGQDWEEFHGKLYEEVFGHVQRDMLTKKVHVHCIGAKGVGKTYLLNKMTAQEEVAKKVREQEAQAARGSEEADEQMDFKAAVTTTYVYNELAGLSDPRTSQQAAEAIMKALKEGERHRLFIIVTLEAGRVRPDDSDMLHKVLEAAQAIGPNYNVIVNKVEPVHIYQLLSPKNREEIANALFKDIPQHLHSKYIWFVEKCGKLPPRMVSDAAEASLGPGAVHRIEVETEEEKALKLRDEVRDLSEKGRLLREELTRATMLVLMPPLERVEVLEGHTGEVTSVAMLSLTSEKYYIASGSRDETARLWVWDGRNQATKQFEPYGEPFQGHGCDVTSVSAWLDDDHVPQVAIGGQDGTVRSWKPGFGEEVWHVHDASVTSVCEYDEYDGTAKEFYRGIISGSEDTTVRACVSIDGKTMRSIMRGHSREVTSVAVARMYDLVKHECVSGSRDQTVRVWDCMTGKQVGKPLLGHSDDVTSVATCFRYIVSGSRDQTVRIWDRETHKQVGEPLQGHNGEVTSVAIDFKARYVVSGGQDQTVRVWDTNTGKQVGEPLRGHTGEVTSVSISGKCVVSGSRDQTVRVWHIAV